MTGVTDMTDIFERLFRFDEDHLPYLYKIIKYKIVVVVGPVKNRDSFFIQDFSPIV